MRAVVSNKKMNAFDATVVFGIVVHSMVCAIRDGIQHREIQTYHQRKFVFRVLWALLTQIIEGVYLIPLGNMPANPAPAEPVLAVVLLKYIECLLFEFGRRSGRVPLPHQSHVVFVLLQKREQRIRPSNGVIEQRH